MCGWAHQKKKNWFTRDYKAHSTVWIKYEGKLFTVGWNCIPIHCLSELIAWKEKNFIHLFRQVISKFQRPCKKCLITLMSKIGHVFVLLIYLKLHDKLMFSKQISLFNLFIHCTCVWTIINVLTTVCKKIGYKFTVCEEKNVTAPRGDPNAWSYTKD